MPLDKETHDHYAYEELLFSQLELFIYNLQSENTNLQDQVTTLDSECFKDWKLFKNLVLMCSNLHEDIQSYLTSLEPLYEELKLAVENKTAKRSDIESIIRPTCDFMSEVRKDYKAIDTERERVDMVLDLINTYNHN